MSQSRYSWIATCPKGLEELLRDELMELGAESVTMKLTSVSFDGDLALAYRVCLWSRLANRILMPITEYSLNDGE